MTAQQPEIPHEQHPHPDASISGRPDELMSDVRLGKLREAVQDESHHEESSPDPSTTSSNPTHHPRVIQQPKGGRRIVAGSWKPPRPDVVPQDVSQDPSSSMPSFSLLAEHQVPGGTHMIFDSVPGRSVNIKNPLPSFVKSMSSSAARSKPRPSPAPPPDAPPPPPHSLYQYPYPPPHHIPAFPPYPQHEHQQFGYAPWPPPPPPPGHPSYYQQYEYVSYPYPPPPHDPYAPWYPPPPQSSFAPPHPSSSRSKRLPMPPRASTSRIPRPQRPASPAHSSTDVEPRKTQQPASSSRSPLKKRSSASMLRASDFKRASADSLPPLPPPPPLPTTDSTTATPAPLSAPFSPPLNPSPPPLSKAKKKSHASARPPDHTPRPPNSWILYRSDVMKKIKNAKAEGREFEIPPGLVEVVAKEGGEGILQQDLSKLISCFWRNESKEVKTAYAQLSQVKKREHAIQYPDYRYQPVRKSATNASCQTIPIPTNSSEASGSTATDSKLKKKKSSLSVKTKNRASPYDRVAKDNKSSGSRSSSKGREGEEEKEVQSGWVVPPPASGNGQHGGVDFNGWQMASGTEDGGEYHRPHSSTFLDANDSRRQAQPDFSYPLDSYGNQPQPSFVDPFFISSSSSSDPSPSYSQQAYSSHQPSQFEFQQQRPPTFYPAYGADDFAEAQLARTFPMPDEDLPPIPSDDNSAKLPVGEIEANHLAAMWSLLEDDPVDPSSSSARRDPALASAFYSQQQFDEGDFGQEVSYTSIADSSLESSGWTGVPWSLDLGGKRGKEIPVDFDVDDFPGMMDGFDFDLTGGTEFDASAVAGEGGSVMLEEGERGFERHMTVAELVEQEWQLQQVSGGDGVEGEGDLAQEEADLDLLGLVGDSNTFDSNQAMIDLPHPTPFPTSSLPAPSIFTYAQAPPASSKLPTQEASYGDYPTGGVSSCLEQDSFNASSPGFPAFGPPPTPSTSTSRSLSSSTHDPNAFTPASRSPRLFAPTISSRPPTASNRSLNSNSLPSHEDPSLAPPLELSAQPGYLTLAIPAPVEHFQHAVRRHQSQQNSYDQQRQPRQYEQWTSRGPVDEHRDGASLRGEEMGDLEEEVEMSPYEEEADEGGWAPPLGHVNNNTYGNNRVSPLTFPTSQPYSTLSPWTHSAQPSHPATYRQQTAFPPTANHRVISISDASMHHQPTHRSPQQSPTSLASTLPLDPSSSSLPGALYFSPTLSPNEQDSPRTVSSQAGEDSLTPKAFGSSAATPVDGRGVTVGPRRSRRVVGGAYRDRPAVSDADATRNSDEE